MNDKTETDTNGTENGTNGMPWQEQLSMGVAQVQGFLEALVVLDRYTIVDLLKNEYEFEPVLSARRVIQAGLQMDRIVSGKVDSQILAETKNILAKAGRMAAIKYFFHQIIEDESTQNEFQKLFELLHPELLLDAQENAAEAHAKKKVRKGRDKGPPPTHILDLFEPDALIEALVPFFARYGTRIGQVAARMVARPESPTSSRPNPSPP